MNSKINVAIIGKNFGYKVIFKVINKVKSFNVIAFCFKNKSNINFDKNIKIYDNWKKLLKNRKINAVIITSPPKTHFNIIKESIKRNIHIFCEKPVTISLSQISQICKLIKKKKNIKHFVNFEFPRICAFEFFKKKISKNIKINKISVDWFIQIPHQNRPSWKNDHKKGGGIFFNYICHSLYYLEDLFGKFLLIKSLKNSSNYNAIFQNQNKNFKIQLNLKILSSNSKKNPIHKIKIFSNKGIFYLESKTKSLRNEFILRKSKKVLFKPKVSTEDFRLEPTLKNLKNFEKNIINNELTKPNFFDAKRVHQLINKLNS